MVTLKNVIKKDNILTADYFAEEKTSDIGHIEYDLNTNKVTKLQYCKEDESSFLKTYSHKAVLAIRKLLKEEEIPKIFVYMWY